MVNVFLRQFTAEISQDVHILLLWDQVGFHMSKQLKIPENVTIVPLPPYSPELNPVENPSALLRLMRGKEPLLTRKQSNQFALLNMLSAINNRNWYHYAIAARPLLFIPAFSSKFWLLSSTADQLIIVELDVRKIRS
jgi:transposase